MSTDPTVPQDADQRRHSRKMSLQESRPPTEVPGYDPERFLGVGAYGEVWVAVEKNTGRRVAVKFYAHRGGLDWSLLSREVEKLAFLFADRYVVQLIGVGWDADPPYYMMEYLERGSLAQRMEEGPIPVEDAVDLFRDVATGLVHAHGKGVLHCDLKPANILLDQDGKPRLADFGQSRLSHEQAPALGTLFYMAPEQADLKAVPDARWDVYALGALLYCMLTGRPPHRSEETVARLEQGKDLGRRLRRYQQIIRSAPKPTEHRQVRGVDRELAEIIDRCLAADPKRRFPNVQAVLDALNVWQLRRQRRPLIVLGALGPALLLLVMAFFAWRGFHTVIQRSEDELTAKALESNKFAAQYVARAAASEVGRRYRGVEQMTSSEALRRAYRETIEHPELRPMLQRLARPDIPPEEHEQLLDAFFHHSQRKKLQQALNDAIPPHMQVGNKVNSWFLNDRRGVQLARVPEVPENITIGRCYAWRTYFYGGAKDHDPSWRPAKGQHVKETGMSAVYQSQATNLWNVAVTTPISFQGAGDEDGFAGIGGLTVGVGDLVELRDKGRQFAVLVETPTKNAPGHILEHPLYGTVHGEDEKLPDHFSDYHVTRDELPETAERKRNYRDPFAADPQGSEYDRRWLAEMAPVTVGRQDAGWLVIVQESYDAAIGTTLDRLRRGLLWYGLAALAAVALVIAAIWTFSVRMLNRASPTRLSGSGGDGTENSTGSVVAGSFGSGVTPDQPTETYRVEKPRKTES